MQSAKQDIQKVLDNLPDDASIEEMQYQLYMLEKVRKGREDIAQHRSYTQTQAKERLSKWMTKSHGRKNH